jgi:hypothetical protein
VFVRNNVFNAGRDCKRTNNAQKCAKKEVYLLAVRATPNIPEAIAVPPTIQAT